MTDPTTQYALDVVEGRILTGELVRFACQRHVDDLEASQQDLSFPFYFDEDAVDNVLAFCPLCHHFEGEWAGQPFPRTRRQDLPRGRKLHGLSPSTAHAGDHHGGIRPRRIRFGGQLYDYMKRVVTPKSEVENDEAFAFNAQLDKDDDPDDERVWIKANPNLGVSKKLEWLRGECRRSQRVPLGQRQGGTGVPLAGKMPARPFGSPWGRSIQRQSLVSFHLVVARQRSTRGPARPDPLELMVDFLAGRVRRPA